MPRLESLECKADVLKVFNALIGKRADDEMFRIAQFELVWGKELAALD